MDEAQALGAFAALSEPTRLRVLHLLVKAGREGWPAGKIGEAVGASSSLLSFHLSTLKRAGLVFSRREARSTTYSAAYDSLTDLITFLARDCCGGRPEICQPAVDALTCCTPALTSSAVCAGLDGANRAAVQQPGRPAHVSSLQQTAVERAEICDLEYRQVDFAYRTLIVPLMDASR